MRAAAALAALLLAAACGPSADESAAVLHADPLYVRAERAGSVGPCARRIPLEFGRGFPVPAKSAGYKLFYYPLIVVPGKSEVLTPQFEAEFDGATPDSCRPTGRGPAVSLGPGARAGISNAEYYRADAAFYAALPRAAALYRGAPAGADDKAALAAFFDAFAIVAEPGLLPDYYRLNPDFWEWLRGAVGKSVPKPAP